MDRAAQLLGRAQSYLDRMAACDLDGALALVTDQARFWTPGLPEMGTAELRAFFAQVLPLVERMTFTVEGHTVAGDRVALEARSHADLRNGRTYANRYHFLFRFEGERIAEVREYCDTAPAKAAFFDGAP
jgi:ketosteroid isomerase-like protein